MLTRITNILFDLDGTLTDPREGITRCLQYALGQLHQAIPPWEELTWCIGPPLKASLAQLLNTTDPAILDQALGHYRKRFSEKGLFENSLYPGVVSALGELQRAGLNLFLATSKPRIFATQILHHFQIARFFQTAYGSELDGRLSDKSELIAHIIDQEGLDSALTVMVGDRVFDIEGGKKNKLVTAAVAYGYGTREEIAAADPDVVFETIADLSKTMLSLRTT